MAQKSRRWARLAAMALSTFGAIAAAGVATGIVASTTSCGAEGVAAPHVISPSEDTGCPSADEAFAHTRAVLDQGLFDPLRPQIRSLLVDRGGLRLTVQALSAIIQETPGDTLVQLKTAIQSGTHLGKLVPHLVDILRYINGTSPFIPGEHYEPIVAAHSILTQCSAPQNLDTLRRVFELEVKRTPNGPVLVGPGLGDTSWTGAVFEALHAAGQEPTIKTLFQKVQINGDDGSGKIVVGRDAFQVLFRLLSGNIAAPNFDLNTTRQLIEDTLVRSLDANDPARGKIHDLLDLLALVVNPQSDVFPGVQGFMQCVNTKDHDGAIPLMLFDYFGIKELPLDQLLNDVSDATSDEAAAGVRKFLVQALIVLGKHNDLVSDVTDNLAGFLEPDNAKPAVDTILTLQGKGVVAELSKILTTFGQCQSSSSTSSGAP